MAFLASYSHATGCSSSELPNCGPQRSWTEPAVAREADSGGQVGVKMTQEMQLTESGPPVAPIPQVPPAPRFSQSPSPPDPPSPSRPSGPHPTPVPLVPY